MNRRYLLIAAAAFAASCAGRGATGPAAATSPLVRAPQVGQRWRYAKRDLITGAPLDAESFQVAHIGDRIELTSQSDPQRTAANTHWDPLSFAKRSNKNATPRPLPSEVQQPWGLVIIDPHWKDVQMFKDPVPLWPSELRPGWSGRFHTEYRTAESEDFKSWQLSMEAHRWEQVTVPAGRFRALRFTNLIDFASQDFSRRTSQRRETLWLAPEIGRWVARESEGTYYRDESVDDQRLLENAFRWELLEWS